MNFVRKTAMPLAICVALLIHVVAFSWYWIAEPIVMFVWVIPLEIAVALVIIWSIIAIFAYRGMKRILPLAIMIAALALAYFVPYSTLSTHLDFKRKQQAMTQIALQAQQGQLAYKIIDIYKLGSGGSFSEYLLPDDKRWLVKQESFYTSDVTCGKFVFFPSFYGIPDGVGGFLYVPECAEPKEFLGGRFGAKWFGVNPLEGRWFRIDGT